MVWFRIAGGKHHGAIGARGGADRRARRAARRRARHPARRRARHVGRRAARARRRAARVGTARPCRSRRVGRRPDAARGHRRVRLRSGARARLVRPRRHDRGRVRVRHRSRRRRRVHGRARDAGKARCGERCTHDTAVSLRSSSTTRKPRRDVARRPPLVPPRPSPRRSAAVRHGDDPRSRVRPSQRHWCPTGRPRRTTCASSSTTSSTPTRSSSFARSYAPNLVTGLGPLDGRPIGIVANQPQQRAGTLDIEASRKAARFVAWCDTFNLPIVTFVDTPGFEPGTRSRVARHDPPRRRARARLLRGDRPAALRRACARPTAARTSSWTRAASATTSASRGRRAEIAVMGAPRRGADPPRQALACIDADERVDAEQALVAEYEATFSNPYRAAERGLVDAVIDPRATRGACCATRSTCSRTKRDTQPRRQALEHSRSDAAEGTMLLADKRILVTGVLNDASIAFSVAQRAQEEGAEVVLDVVRPRDEPHRSARRAGCRPSPRSSSSTSPTPTHLDALADRVGGQLDGVLHAIGFAPESCLGGGFLTAPWEDVAVALQVSAYSLKALAVACRPLMRPRRLDRRPRLRQQPRRLARLRLDGRRQGRVRSRPRATSRARSRARRASA